MANPDALAVKEAPVSCTENILKEIQANRLQRNEDDLEQSRIRCVSPFLVKIVYLENLEEKCIKMWFRKNVYRRGTCFFFLGGGV